MTKMNNCIVCKNEDVKSCSRCHLISYCSKECQKSDWKRHKKQECNGEVARQKMQILQESAEPEEVISHLNGPCFICTEIPGKGEGLVATRTIEYGELIIHERPIMETVGPLPLQKEKDLKKIFGKLSVEDQNTIMAMHDAHAVNGFKTLVGILNTNSFAR